MWHRRNASAGLVVCLTLAAAGAGTCQAGSFGPPVTADGYTFNNFDFPDSGSLAGAGTTVNGIANNGTVVGFSTDNNGNLLNGTRNANGSFTSLDLGAAGNSMANGINSAGSIVGQQNGFAFFLPNGGAPQPIFPASAGSSTAFGINDKGNIVGQYSTAGSNPGFFLSDASGKNLITINAPPPSANTVNAQSVNDNGLVVGFFVGSDGQYHGFLTNVSAARNGILTVTQIVDPTIPTFPGEPGATFVFSQILGVNDQGLAVGYYGDSTVSQHGFLYNTQTGVYTFVDDPSEQFDNGVEVTQITGITNSGEITGFYSDATAVDHGFVACPVDANCSSTLSAAPEPTGIALTAVGLAMLAFALRKPVKRTAPAGML